MAIKLLKEQYDLSIPAKLEVFRRLKDNILCYRIIDLDVDENITFVQFKPETPQEHAVDCGVDMFDRMTRYA